MRGQVCCGALSGYRQGRRVKRILRLISAVTVALGAVLSAGARPPVAQPVPARHRADARFAHGRARVRDLRARRSSRWSRPISAARPSTRASRGVDGTLRDYSPAALQKEDARLAEFRARFSAHRAGDAVRATRRIDRSVALAEIAFLLHQHQVRRYQQRSLDSYVDEPFRGVDWQIQGMTATGASTYGTEAEWQAVIARARAVPAYLATAERQLSAGIDAHETPDWRVLRDYGLQSSAGGRGVLRQDAAADRRDRHQLPRTARRCCTICRPPATMPRRPTAICATSSPARFFADVHAEGRAALKPDYRADRFAFGEAEYDWALHNNLRVSGSASELFAASWPIVAGDPRRRWSRSRSRSPPRTSWPHTSDGARTVRQVFEQMSQNAPRTDAEMVDGYRKTGQRLVAYARDTGSVRRAGGLPPRRDRDAAAAARLDRGRRLLPGAALQEERRRPLLRDPDRRRRWRSCARSTTMPPCRTLPRTRASPATTGTTRS